MNVFGFITRIAKDDLDPTVEFEAYLDPKTELYPSDAFRISFDIADDVQIAIDIHNRLYVECVDLDGNSVKTILANLG